VHNTFAREAQYVSEEGATPIPARIRLHTKFLRMGDLDREGYARVIDDVNEVRIDIGELTPVRLATIDFGNGVKFSIVNVVPDKDDNFWTCEVAPV